MQLEGKIEKSNIKYKWVTEPGACKKCKELEGKLFDTLKEFEAARPHPHCKCDYEIIKDDTEEQARIEEELARAAHQKEIEEEQEKLHIQAAHLSDSARELYNKIQKTIPIIYDEIENLKRIKMDKIHYSTMQIEEVSTEINELLKRLNLAMNLQNSVSKIIKNIDQMTKNYIEPKDLDANKEQINKNWQQLKEDVLFILANKYLALAYGKEHSQKHMMPQAYELFKIGVNADDYNKEYVRKNGVLLNKIEDIGNLKLQYEIKNRIRQENTNPTNMKVLVFKPNSSMSKTIKKSGTLKNFLKKNMNELSIYGRLDNQTIEFDGQNSQSYFSKILDEDLYASFHGAEVKDIHLDAEGNLHLRIVDLYNFNKYRFSLKGRVGRKLQEQGVLKPYYIICPVFISKEELQKY